MKLILLRHGESIWNKENRFTGWTDVNNILEKDINLKIGKYLEKELIKTLMEQGYEYLTFNSESELISNLRDKLGKLNNHVFSDNEWNI